MAGIGILNNMPKYENFSKEELLRFIEKQEQELAQKKYGLVWDAEREPEQVVLDCENNLPVLKRVRGKAIKEPKDNGAEDNILIEGDNYHALTVLNYTHKEKIDVIYIDPPYNTGNKSWKYNNNYVEKDDGYYHSKWLNMMEKRLNNAKKLLKQDGVLICAIDENEFANLYLLLSKIFPSFKIDQIVVIHNPGGVQGQNFSYSHEYALFVFPNGGKYISLQDRQDNPDIRPLRDVSKGDHLRTDAANCFYPIFVEENKVIGFGEVCDDNFHPNSANINKKAGLMEIYPIDAKGNERKWVFSRQSVESIQGELSVEFNKNRKIFDIIRKKTNFNYKTVWTDKKYNANAYGTKLLAEIINIKFPYPKSIYTVEECLKAAIHDKDRAIILDYFAGSGTTGHAVLKMNKEDGGNRKFILCTNNENNICTEVCYPRVEKVIKGYKKNGNGEKVEGLGGNLQYFKTAMVKKSNNKDQVRLNLTRECTEMLCVKENIFNLEIEKEDFKIYFSNKNDKFLCIYYNILDNSLGEFIKEIKKLKGDKIIYMFSADDIVDKKLFKGIKDLTIKAIPQRILDVYKQLVKMNIPVKKELIFLEINKAKTKIFEEKEKNEGARILRIVLEKTIQKVAQNSGLNIYSAKGKEEKISSLNDILKKEKIITQVEWEETKTYLTIGNHASHGDYAEYDLGQVQNFYKHIQNLLNKFNI